MKLTSEDSVIFIALLLAEIDASKIREIPQTCDYTKIAENLMNKLGLSSIKELKSEGDTK